MTLRSNIDASALSLALTRLEAQHGTDQPGAALAAHVGSALDAAMLAIHDSLRGSGLTIPTDDRWRECEAVIFGMLRNANAEAFKAAEPVKPTHSLSYYVEAERYWQFAREGSEAEMIEASGPLKSKGLKFRIRPINV